MNKIQTLNEALDELFEASLAALRHEAWGGALLRVT
jgi:hypothetical protein